MEAIAIHAHPVPESFNAALLGAVIEEFDACDGRKLTVADLNAGDDPGVDELVAATTLILVYPTWWGGFPAILLDWVQRHLGRWIDGERFDRSPLRNIERIVAITTHGSNLRINAGVQGEPGRQLVQRSMASLCADGVRVDWVAMYGLDSKGEQDRRAFIEDVRKAISAI